MSQVPDHVPNLLHIFGIQEMYLSGLEQEALKRNGRVMCTWSHPGIQGVNASIQFQTKEDAETFFVMMRNSPINAALDVHIRSNPVFLEYLKGSKYYNLDKIKEESESKDIGITLDADSIDPDQILNDAGIKETIAIVSSMEEKELRMIMRDMQRMIRENREDASSLLKDYPQLAHALYHIHVRLTIKEKLSAFWGE